MAGFVTLNGNDVVEAAVNLPRQGCWNASLVVDADTAPDVGSSATLVLGSLSLKGTVRKSGVFTDTVQIEMIGGAGGLSKLATPKFYSGIPSGNVIRDILGGAGETLSASVDPSLLTTLFSNWTTIRQPAGSALSNVVKLLGDDLVWRPGSDGTIWIGTDTWQAARIEYDLLDKDDYLDRWLLGIEDPGALQPGVTLDGRKVDYVEVTVTTSKVRARVWLIQ